MNSRFIFLVFLGLLQSLFMYAPGNPNDGAWYTDEFGPLQSNYSMGDFVRYTASSGGTTVPRNPVNPAYKNQAIGYNIYYNMVNIPYAQDIFNIPTTAGMNTDNLYNFVGYLYAGYAALNINPTDFVKTNWLTTFRKANQWQSGSLGFDNNPSGIATIQLVNYTDPNTPFSGTSLNSDPNYPVTYFQGNLSNNELAYLVPCKNLYYPNLDVNHGQFFLNADINYFVEMAKTYNQGLQNYGHPRQEGQQLFAAMLSYAKASCAWNTNYTDGNYVLSIPSYGNGYAAPYGQFFGARLSHILGALVNDMPSSKAAAITATWPAMLTGTPAPQIAQLGSYTPPAGSMTPSTAHFGSFQNFLNDWLKSSKGEQAATQEEAVENTLQNSITKSTFAYSYLANHLMPMLQRFNSVAATAGAGTTATTPLCSYGIASVPQTGISYIDIQDSSVTPFDNGMIVAIANNTGDQLQVKQCNKATDIDDQIGMLQTGVNHYFLHTASMMNQSGQPAMHNMIEIKDVDASQSIFVQLMTGTQLQNTATALNTAFTTAGSTLFYNQNNEYLDATTNAISFQPESSAMYVVVSNFDVNNVTTIKCTTMERIQAINLNMINAMISGSEIIYNNAPYCLTLQINKQKTGDGFQQPGSYSFVNSPAASATPSMADASYALYPSIVSVKPLYLWNPYAQVSTAPNHRIPLILLPDGVLNAGFAGLQAMYGIWLMSYAAALTEFSFGCEFGNMIDCLNKTFGMFNVARTESSLINSVQQYPPARVVIDVSGNLKSGQVVHVQPVTDGMYQSRSQYLDLIGCDVFDIGGNFHSDIPVLNLSENASGNIVMNQVSGVDMNIAVRFMPDLDQGSKTITTFADGYGLPYQYTALMSLPTSDLSSGLLMNIYQVAVNEYEIIWQTPLTADQLQAMQAQALQDQTTLNQSAISGGQTTVAALTTLVDNLEYGVLGYQKIFLDQKQDITGISIEFVNSSDQGWTSSTMIPVTQLPAVGKSAVFQLSYVVNGSQNELHVQQAKKPTKAQIDAARSAARKKAILKEKQQEEAKELKAKKGKELQIKQRAANDWWLHDGKDKKAKHKELKDKKDSKKVAKKDKEKPKKEKKFKDKKELKKEIKKEKTKKISKKAKDIEIAKLKAELEALQG